MSVTRAGTAARVSFGYPCGYLPAPRAPIPRPHPPPTPGRNDVFIFLYVHRLTRHVYKTTLTDVRH